MATGFTHAFLGLAMGKSLLPKGLPGRFWLLCLLCSTLPDLDAIGFFGGIPYGSMLGHRGFTHSLIFALLSSWVVARWGFHPYGLFLEARWKLWAFFFFLSCSHGVLDALTNGGLGVAFFSPFDPTRYHLPRSPLMISPLRLDLFFTSWGREVTLNELSWVWVPSILLFMVLRAASRLKSRQGLSLGR